MISGGDETSPPLVLLHGEKDVLIDQAETRTGLRKASKLAPMRYLDGVGQLILGQTAAVSEFVERSWSRHELAHR